MKAKEKSEKKAKLKAAANGPKERLMQLSDEMAELSTRKAEGLNRIIRSLENWQNTP